MNTKLFYSLLGSVLLVGLKACGSGNKEDKADEQFMVQHAIPSFAAVAKNEYPVEQCLPLAFTAHKDLTPVGLKKSRVIAIKKEGLFPAKQNDEKPAVFNVYSDGKCTKSTESATLPPHDSISVAKVYIKASAPGKAWLTISYGGDGWGARQRVVKNFVVVDQP